MAKVQVTSPVARIVQGSVGLRDKLDRKTRQPKVDPKTGEKIRECFIALAIPKTDTSFNEIYAQMVAVAKAKYPGKFDPNTGQLKPNARFAMKLVDGDGYDNDGELNSKKEGFAGHWVLKLNTRFAPRCHPAGRYDPASEIPNAENVIKCGHWVRVSFTIDDNGVADGDPEAIPGLFLSPTLIEYVGIGAEITQGLSAQDAFGGLPAAVLPPGVQPVGNIPTAANPGGLPNSLPTPTGGTPQLPPTNVAPAVGTPQLPNLPQTTPQLPQVGAPQLPPVGQQPQLPPLQPQGPQYGPGPNLPAGMTIDAALATPGYTPDALIQHGYIVRL